MDNEKIFDSILVDDIVFEIRNNALVENRYNVPTDTRINIDELTKDDTEPMFATVEIIRNGKSQNNRNYPVSVVQDLANKVVGTVSYLGHSDKSKAGFEFREPQGIMVGSLLLSENDGTTRLLGKSYIFKNSPLREWLPKSMACGNPMSVSIQGKAKCFENLDKSIDVAQIVSLDSIDWCNAGTQGMANSINLSLTSEMIENPNSNINVDEKGVNGMADIIKDDIIVEEPVIEQIEEPVVEQIEEPVEEPVVEQIEQPLDNITEMTNKISELETTISEKDARISELENEISEMRAEQERKEIEAYKQEKIEEQIDEDHREAFAKRITGTTKEEIDNQISEMVDFLREMGRFDNPVPAPVKKEGVNTDDIREQVIALFAGK